MSSEKAISLIAIEEHGIPHVFPAEVLPRPRRRAEPRRIGAPRGSARRCRSSPSTRPDARDHDDAVCAEPDPDQRTRAASSSRSPSPMSPTTSGPARRSTARRSDARQLGLFPRPRRADAAGADLQRSLLAARGRGPPLPRRAHAFDAEGRKRGHTLPPRRDALGGKALLRAGAGRDRRRAPTPRPSPLARAGPEAALGRLRGARAAAATRREPLDARPAGAQVLLDEDGSVDRIVVPPRLDAHRLIEEFMIQANVAAAETLEAKSSAARLPHPRRALLREARGAARVPRLARHELSEGRQPAAGQFNRILARVAGTPHELLVNEVVLRSQSQAEYAPENIGHFGLNLPPLRAFHLADPPLCRPPRASRADRALKPRRGRPAPQDETHGSTAIAGADLRRRAARHGGRARHGRPLIAAWLAERVGADFEGRIRGVTRAGLFVELTRAAPTASCRSRRSARLFPPRPGAPQAGRRAPAASRPRRRGDGAPREAAPITGGLILELLSVEGATLPARQRAARKAGRERIGKAKAARARRRGRAKA